MAPYDVYCHALWQVTQRIMVWCDTTWHDTPWYDTMQEARRRLGRMTEWRAPGSDRGIPPRESSARVVRMQTGTAVFQRTMDSWDVNRESVPNLKRVGCPSRSWIRVCCFFPKFRLRNLTRENGRTLRIASSGTLGGWSEGCAVRLRLEIEGRPQGKGFAFCKSHACQDVDHDSARVNDA